MNNSRKIILPLVLLLPVFLGCNLIEKFKNGSGSGSPAMAAPKVVTSNDGACRFTVPDLWEKVPALSSDANIQVSDRFNDAHVMVVREPRIDMAADVTIDDYVTLLQQTLPNHLDDVQLAPAETFRIHTYEGKQFYAVGTAREIKVRVKYIYTVIMTENEFFQIISWTSPSRYEKNKPTMLSVIRSFRVIPPGPQDIQDDQPLQTVDAPQPGNETPVKELKNAKAKPHANQP
jgi:hypothetical protein